MTAPATAPRPASSPATSLSSADRWLVLAGMTSAALAVGVAGARLAGAIPQGWAVSVILLLGAAAGSTCLKVAGRRATAERRQQVMGVVANLGLGVSTLGLVVALPKLTEPGGWGTFAADLGAHLWVIGLLLVVALPARTLGWRVQAGMAFTGFLAVPALARAIGEPMLDRLGADSTFVRAVWVPVTENLLQLLLLLVVALLAARRKDARPAALDLMLLGAWVGAGFALSENAAYGRGGPHWSVAKPMSWLFPTAHGGAILDTWWFGAGHVIAVAAMGLAIGLSVLYRRRWRRAVLAAPLLYLVTVGEHILNNLIAGQTDTPWVTALQIATARGTLAATLLVGGAVWLVQVEQAGPTLLAAARRGILLRPGEARVRMVALAQLQTRRVSPGSDPRIRGAASEQVPA